MYSENLPCSPRAAPKPTVSKVEAKELEARNGRADDEKMMRGRGQK
jgi:hypothetical protein